MAAKKRLTRRPQPQPSSASRVPQRLTSDALVYTEYDITDEPLYNRAIKKLPAQVQARIDDLYGRRQPFVRNGPIGFLTNRVGRDSVPIRAAKSMIEL